MAVRSKSLSGGEFIEAHPKKTRQGNGKHTKYAASSRNGAKKRYRGQGKQCSYMNTLWRHLYVIFLQWKYGFVKNI